MPRPSQSSLTARSAQSLISPEYIRNYTSPVSDYSQVLQMAPGTFSTSTNGPGLGDTKTFFRGFKDGYYSMTYDGIPFNDTNDPTHHSWAFFPAQTIGSTVFDRSPGSAATIGPSTYGGSVDAAVAIAEFGAGRQRDRVVRLVQHEAVRRRLQLGPLRPRRQVAADDRPARHAVGWLPDVQLPAPAGVLGASTSSR